MPGPHGTPGITEFSGPNENPLSEDGAWAEYGRDPLQRYEGGVVGTVEFAVNGMYYVPSPVTFSGDTFEMWACASPAGLGAALETHRLCFWLGTPNSFTGYLFAYGGGIGETFFMRRYNGDPSSFDLIGNWGAGGFQKLALRITPTHVEGYYESAGVWTLVGAVEDTTYRGAPWYAALETEEQGGVFEVGFGCFGGGFRRRSQIYRYVSN